MSVSRQNPHYKDENNIPATGLDGPLSIVQILFSFKGRIPRRVYWGATLGTHLFFFVILFFLAFLAGEGRDADGVVAILGMVAMPGMLAVCIPMIWSTLAIHVKRFHDRDKSGWWYLVNFVPCIGPLWLVLECGCMRGTTGPNRYGQDPTPGQS